MSTKVTWLYDIPERDGEENDYHLYFDYKDFTVHLEINGKEVCLPPKLRSELEEVFRLYFDVVNTVARVVAHAQYRGLVNSYLSAIERVGKGAFGRSDDYDGGEDGDDELTPEEREELRRRIEELEKGESYTFDEDEVKEYLEKGYHTHVHLNDSGLELQYLYNAASGEILVVIDDGEDVEVLSGIQPALDYIVKRGATKRDVKKFLETAVGFLRARGSNGSKDKDS